MTSLIATMAVAAPAGQGAMPQDLARAVAAYDAATVSNDVARLNAIVRDDYILVNSDMSVQGKASYLADFKVPGFKIDRYQLNDPILIVRADSALTGGSFHLSWTQGGRVFDRELRIVHFWVKDGTQWQLAYTQLTRQPAADLTLGGQTRKSWRVPGMRPTRPFTLGTRAPAG